MRFRGLEKIGERWHVRTNGLPADIGDQLVGDAGKNGPLRFVSCCMALLFFAFPAGQIYAAEPTLEETIEFIDTQFHIERKNISYYDSKGFLQFTEYRVRMLESNKISVEGIQESSGRGVGRDELQFSMEVSLRDLSTEIEPGVVIWSDPPFNAPGGYKSYKITINCARPKCMKWTDGDFSTKYTFYVSSQTILDKVVKAFTHAIKISGGKDDLF